MTDYTYKKMFRKYGIIYFLLVHICSVKLLVKGETTCESIDDETLYQDFFRLCADQTEDVCLHTTTVTDPDPTAKTIPKVQLNFDPLIGTDEYDAVVNSCAAKNGMVCRLNSSVSISTADYIISGYPICVPDSCSEEGFISNFSRHPICATDTGDTCDFVGSPSTMTCPNNRLADATAAMEKSTCGNDLAELDKEGWDVDLMSNIYMGITLPVMMSCTDAALGKPNDTCDISMTAAVSETELIIESFFDKMMSYQSYASFNKQCSSSMNHKICTFDAKFDVSISGQSSFHIVYKLTAVPVCVTDNCTEKEGINIAKSKLMSQKDETMSMSLDEMCNGGGNLSTRCHFEFFNYNCSNAVVTKKDDSLLSRPCLSGCKEIENTNKLCTNFRKKCGGCAECNDITFSCKSLCRKSKKEWSKKCNILKCAGCEECKLN